MQDSNTALPVYKQTSHVSILLVKHETNLVSIDLKLEVNKAFQMDIYVGN